MCMGFDLLVYGFAAYFGDIDGNVKIKKSSLGEATLLYLFCPTSILKIPAYKILLILNHKLHF